MKIVEIIKSTYILPIIGIIFALSVIGYKSYNYYNAHKEIKIKDSKVQNVIKANPFQ